MIVHQINYDCPLLPINNKKVYFSKTMKKLKSKLDNAKNQLDVEYKNPWFGRYWKEFDPFRREKYVVAKMGNTINVSNAWIKCYEILKYFDLIPNDLTNNEFLHFDNAAFPGSFAISTHHLIKTTRPWHNKYKWVASSLFSPNEENAAPLEDKYKLYQNYPENWLMNEQYNGDVLLRENQEYFHNELKGKVDLYTSDLGFDVSNDYNNQELIQLPANIGQILSGILTLKTGGGFITKQYMTFEMITVSVMFALSQLFDKFYLCKPYTSREANSETYLVGKGFKGHVGLDHPYVKAMFDRIIVDELTGKTKVKLEIPLFDAKQYPNGYLKDITKASKYIFEKQIKKINHDIDASKKCINSNYRGKTWNHPIVRNFHNGIKNNIEKWYMSYKIYPISEDRKLDMRDALHQG